MAAKIIQAVIIVVIISFIVISGYYVIYAMVTDDEIPGLVRLTSIVGVIAFLAGLIYVIWDRKKTSEKETFRREKW